MKWLNRILLRFVLNSEMKRANKLNVTTLSAIFFEINMFVHENFHNYYNVFGIYPFSKVYPQSSSEFIQQEQDTAQARFKFEKME